MDLSYRKLDTVVHQPARLSIMASLSVAHEIEFSVMRDTIDISDSLLSRYIAVLENASYVNIRKEFVNKRPKTWLSLTDEGRKAFEEYVKTLECIVGQQLL